MISLGGYIVIAIVVILILVGVIVWAAFGFTTGGSSGGGNKPSPPSTDPSTQSKPTSPITGNTDNTAPPASPSTTDPSTYPTSPPVSPPVVPPTSPTSPPVSPPVVPPIDCHAGTVNAATGTCKCPKTTSGANCEQVLCVNGGVIDPTNPERCTKCGFGDPSLYDDFCNPREIYRWGDYDVNDVQRKTMPTLNQSPNPQLNPGQILEKSSVDRNNTTPGQGCGSDRIMTGIDLWKGTFLCSKLKNSQTLYSNAGKSLALDRRATSAPNPSGAPMAGGACLPRGDAFPPFMGSMPGTCPGMPITQFSLLEGTVFPGAEAPWAGTKQTEEDKWDPSTCETVTANAGTMAVCPPGKFINSAFLPLKPAATGGSVILTNTITCCQGKRAVK